MVLLHDIVLVFTLCDDMHDMKFLYEYVTKVLLEGYVDMKF